MHHTTKIATCCYCGARAALVFDKTLHELACRNCGAPLHNMKMMPQTKPRGIKPAAPLQPKLQKPSKKQPDKPRPSRKKPSKSRRKSRRRWGKKLFEELWDVVEDVFD